MSKGPELFLLIPTGSRMGSYYWITSGTVRVELILFEEPTPFLTPHLLLKVFYHLLITASAFRAVYSTSNCKIMGLEAFNLDLFSI